MSALALAPRWRRLWLLLALLIGLAAAVTLVLYALRQNLVFSHPPGDVVHGRVPLDRALRVGGIVVPGSLQRLTGGEVRFLLGDDQARLPVRYRGALPDLFAEGQTALATGRVRPSHEAPQGLLFLATEIMAKHDENYRPAELAATVPAAMEARR